jgi:metallo-beta-lactamase family protein
MDFFSAHADQKELIKWTKSIKSKPRKIIITHAEPEPADTLRRKIEEELEIKVHVAQDMEIIYLT